MRQVDLFKLKPQDHVVFRCGGWAQVESIKINKAYRDVDIIFLGEKSAHNYLQNGNDYEHEQSLFDIVRVVDQ
jgi:hypothetical protein